MSPIVVLPQRIQRKRTKGWRMPEGAIYVARPSRWGNPHRDGAYIECDCLAGLHRMPEGAKFTRASAVAAYRVWTADFARWTDTHDYLNLAPLRGHDLACWCPLDQPCHADVLLELANR